MSELRQDPTTKIWVIVAPERAQRPQQEVKKRRVEELPPYDPACPFCPGNEDKTPDEVFRIPVATESPAWDVRVVPNRYAALIPACGVARREHGRFFRRMEGFGVHEVIIESPSHNTPMALMPYEQVEKVLLSYQERYNYLKRNRMLRFITIFKNHGWASGTSLAHPHSQLVATPIIATHYHQKFDIAHDYYSDEASCLYCDLIASEMEQGQRVIAETAQFMVFQPYASRVPFETWIIPKDHYASFGLYPSENLGDLARALKDVLLCLYHELDNPAFNYTLDTSTTADEDDPYYHWHLRIVPRLTTIAGFEIGSGIYINSSLPEETSRRMKECCTSLSGEGLISLCPVTSA
ncbi:MAG: galactose-1-phosphate uridylyltransferase [Chloroflexi bacterium]|nr:galactose-1-phosphate uridylyltransferase [Chloroflexota bacterium]